MKILVMTHAYPPEVRSTSNLVYELSRDMVKKGHSVTVITPLPKYNLDKIPEQYKHKFFLKTKEEGVDIIRISTLPIHLVGPLQRAFGYLFISAAFLILGLIEKRHDAIFVYSTPFTLGLSAYLVSRLKKTPFVFNVQDLFPQGAIDLGLLKNPVLIKLFAGIEKFLCKTADMITVHSEGNKKHVIDHGGNANKTMVISNWVDTGVLKPEEKENAFRKEHNLTGKFVIIFAGVLGYAQDLDVIIESAEKLKNEKDMVFFIVGDGMEKQRIIKKVEELGLQNVRFLPFIPADKYPELVAAADVCLVTLKKTMLTPVVPSKILGIMSCGRPIVASLNNSDAYEIIEQAKAGICVEAGDSVSMADALLKLYKDREFVKMLSENGRKYALANFSRVAATGKYEKIFIDLKPKK